MPAAVAAAFLESTKAEADAKHRRKLACRAARAEAEALRPEPRSTPAAAAAAAAAVERLQEDMPSERQAVPAVPKGPAGQVLGLDGKFVSSGAIRQRLQEMDANYSLNHVR